LPRLHAGKAFGRQAAGARLARDDPHTSSGNGYLRRLTSQSLGLGSPHVSTQQGSATEESADSESIIFCSGLLIFVDLGKA